MTSAPGNKISSGTLLLRTAGLLAVLGGLLNAVSDYLLQGGLVARKAVNTYEFLPEAPFDLVFVGSLVGNAAIPLWLLGFLPVYVALAPAGRWLALPPVVVLGYTFSLFAGYHGSYALYAAGFQARDSAAAPLAESMTTLTERLHAYHDALLGVIGPPSVIGSVWFAVAVLSGKSRFARWMVVLAPIVAPLTQPLVEMLPAPYGGFIRPAWSTSLFTLLFLVATLLTWNVEIDLRVRSSVRTDARKT
ncbi:MAG: DUF6796 family protein [Acidobacteriota bacterium]